jgi:ATP-dependent Lhr-like helicase
VAQDDPDQLAAVVLGATDPANPYGSALPWPAPAVASAPKPMRSAHARVVLVDGMLTAFVRSDRDVATFLPADEPARSAVGRAAALAVARWAVGTGRVHLGWANVDGVPAARTPFASYLVAAGFTPSGAGFRLVEVTGDRGQGRGVEDSLTPSLSQAERGGEEGRPRRRAGGEGT